MKRLPAAQKLVFSSTDKLLMVLQDASVVQVDLKTNQIKEVLSVAVYRQVTPQTKMRLYDRVVSLIDFNSDSGHLVMIFANPIFSGIYNLQAPQG